MQTVIFWSLALKNGLIVGFVSHRLIEINAVNYCKPFLCVVLLVLINACASTRGPVVIRDSVDQSQTTTVTGKTVGGDSSQPQKTAPVVPDAPRTSLPLVEKLIASANQYYQQQRYEQAIEQAERGLRVDRKESRLYLVLAKAYEGQGNKEQARYFARQGLRYAEKGSATQRGLSRLIWQ